MKMSQAVKNLTRPRYPDEIEVPWKVLAGMLLFAVFVTLMFYAAAWVTAP